MFATHKTPESLECLRVTLFRVHMMCNHLTPEVRGEVVSVNVREVAASFMIRFHFDKMYVIKLPVHHKLLVHTKRLHHILYEICRQLQRGKPFCALRRNMLAVYHTIMSQYMKAFKAHIDPSIAFTQTNLEDAVRRLREQYPHHLPIDADLRKEYDTRIATMTAKLTSLIERDTHPNFERANIPLARMSDQVFCQQLLGDEKHTNESIAHNLLKDPTWRLSVSDQSSRQEALMWPAFESFLIDNFVTGCSKVFFILRQVAGRIKDFHETAAAEHNVQMYQTANTLQQAAAQLQLAGANAQTMAGGTVSASVSGAATPRGVHFFDQNGIMLRFIIEKHRNHTIIVSDFLPYVPGMCASLFDCLKHPHAMYFETESRVVLDMFRESPSVNTFAKVLRVMNKYNQHLGLQMANARLDLIHPIITTHGVGYEVEKFEASVASGKIALHGLGSWLRNLIRSTSTQDIVAMLQDDSKLYPAFHKHFFDTIVATFFSEEGRLPETYLLDAECILKLSTTFHFLVTGCCVAATLLHVQSVSAELRTELTTLSESFFSNMKHVHDCTFEYYAQYLQDNISFGNMVDLAVFDTSGLLDYLFSYQNSVHLHATQEWSDVFVRFCVPAAMDRREPMFDTVFIPDALRVPMSNCLLELRKIVKLNERIHMKRYKDMLIDMLPNYGVQFPTAAAGADTSELDVFSLDNAHGDPSAPNASSPDVAPPDVASI